MPACRTPASKRCSSRSPRLGWLAAKDAHELLASRAYWLLLLAVGLLVGHAFLTGVNTYAEMSGTGGGPAALAQGLSPLDGIVIPTLGALSLAATLLLPFVAIRVVAHEKQTGAWKLLVQGPAPTAELLAAKLVVLFVAWLLAWIPVAVALLMWVASGNHLNGPETFSVLLGEALFAWLTIGVAAAAAAIMDGDASAAIVALGFTIGTWAIDFVGAAQGGVVATLAKYTPSAALHSFEQGLVRAGATAVLLIAGTAGLALAGIWLAPGTRPWRRRIWSAAVVIVATALGALGASTHASWDLSEDRRNSFPAADEAALRQLRDPLHVEIHLAAEDPRLADLRTGLLEKLGRQLAEVDVDYRARTRTGLFEQADSHYGEIWYQLGSRRVMSRSTNPEIVLPLLYDLAGVRPPVASGVAYAGFPLAHRPRNVGVVFFAGWPIVLATVMWIRERRRRRSRLHAAG
jgi:ABC-type transport system involved in multi-copper enzyme maturation permease subunit